MNYLDHLKAFGIGLILIAIALIITSSIVFYPLVSSIVIVIILGYMIGLLIYNNC